MKSTQTFDGKEFKIAQPSGSCCEAGCDGCELFTYKKENNINLQNSRMNYYQNLASQENKKNT